MTGVAVGALIASFLDLDALDMMVLGGLFGTAPDLDLLLSGFGRRVHRSSATHSLVASIGFALVWAVVLLASEQLLSPRLLSSFELMPSSFVVSMATFLHAAEDSATVYGCRLLYPISGKIYKGVVKYDDWAANAALSVVAASVTLFSLEVDLSSAFL